VASDALEERSGSVDAQAIQIEMRNAVQAEMRSAVQAEMRSAVQAEMRSAVQAEVRSALRAELDEVLPHVIAALKRHDAVADLARRLDDAEKRLAERNSRPLVAGVRRALNTIRKLDFDSEVKGAILAELERLLVGAGYTEFGEIGESFDPARHDAIAGEAESGAATVQEVFEPGLETLGEIVSPAKVRVGNAEKEAGT
jgi:molecular chaperone GrpE (heat shock protein)